MKVDIVSKNVNSKVLFDAIHETLYDAVTTLGVKWTSDTHRASFVEVIEEYFEDLVEDGKIEQYKVVCDYRNNKGGFSNAKEHIFDVYYKQPHCLNMTQIQYRVQK